MKLISCKFRKVVYFLTAGLLFLSSVVYSQSPVPPGNMPQPYAWFRPQDLSGSSFSTWTDVYNSSTNNFNGTAAIISGSGVFSGNNALFFNGSSDGLFTGLSSWASSFANDNYEIFIIFQDSSYTSTYPLFSYGNPGGASKYYDFTINNSSVNLGIIGTGCIPPQTLISSGVGSSLNLLSIQQTVKSGVVYDSSVLNNSSVQSLSLSSSDYGCAGGTNLNIATTGDGSSWFKGCISEIVIYYNSGSRSLNTAQRKIIQNYFQVKYGSLLSIPSVLYSASLYTGGANFKYGLTGIGKENGSNIQQSSTSDSLTITNNSLSNSNYFLWADNGISSTLWESTNNPPNVKKLQKTWASTMTGTMGMTMNFSIPQSFLSSSVNASYQVPVLLLNSSTSFTSGTRVIALSSDGGSNYIANNVPVSAGDYISFGVLNQYPYSYTTGIEAMGEADLYYTKTSLTDGAITIDNPTSLSAGNYLLIANNNLSTNFDVTYSSSISSTDRIWRISQTGSVGNVDIAIDTTQFGFLPTGDHNYLILISSDGLFSSTNGNTKALGMVKSGNEFKAYNLNLPNGTYISFAASQETITNPKSLTGVFTESTGDLSGGTTIKQLCIAPDSSFSFAGTCSSKLSSATLNLTFNTGKDYPFGNNAFTSTVGVQVQGYTNYTGTGTVSITYNATLTVSNNNPEQLHTFNITNDYSNSIKIYKISITSFSAPSTTLIQDSLVLTASISESYTVNIPITTTSPIENQNYSSNHNVAYTFSWHTDHCSAPSYQFQLLRLYNNDSLTAPGVINTNPDYNVTATMDWSQALTLETDSQNITLTLAEGTGYYAWRVRPIGNVYPGGIADSRNWGNWSTDNIGLGSIVSLSCTTSTCLSQYQNSIFYYVQFDSSRNFIYTRTFTEGAKIHEGITYANGLMQVKQSQQHIPSNTQSGSSNNGEILVGQTVYDYSGRPAMQSMMAPAMDTNNTLGYRTKLLMHHADTLYAAQHFDKDSRIYAPQPIDPVNGGYVNSYYSDNNTDPTIPSANNYPFSRTIYDNEGTGRVIESGGTGDTLQVGKGHTVRIQYGSVSDDELIRVFGDEAPDASTVYKKAVTDQNNVTSITYIDKSGNTLATCLSHNNYTSSLTPLVSQSGAGFNVKEFITKNTPYQTNGLLGAKALDFTDTTQLTVKYEISPTIINSACGNYCSTCGYKLTIKVLDLSDSTKNQVIDTSIAPGSVQSTPCSTSTVPVPINKTNGSDSVTFTLAPGKYIVERILQLDTAAANTYANNIVNNINTILQPVVTSIQGYLNTTDISGLISYLKGLQSSPGTGINVEVYSESGDTLYSATNHHVNNTPLTTLSDGEKVGIITTCCTIKIPVIFPSFDPCSTSWSATDRAAYFVQKLDSTLHGGLSTVMANTMYGSYDSVSLVTVISNMLSEPVPYQCDSLWNCWQALMSTYQGSPISNPGTSRDSLTTRVGSNSPNWAQNMAGAAPTSNSVDVLDQFLECAGKRYVGYTTDKTLIKEKPYKYFYYNRGDSTLYQGYIQCENSFCNYQPFNASMQIQSTFTYPPCSKDLCPRDTADHTDVTYTSSHYETLTIGGHALNQTDYYAFSKCIQEASQSTAIDMTNPADTVNHAALQSQYEASCEAQCANQYNYFYSTLQGMNSNTYLGPELQQNGNLSSHTGGWTVTGGGAPSIDTIAGKIRLDLQPSGTVYSMATLASGVKYELSFTATTSNSSTITVLYNGSDITSLVTGPSVNPVSVAYYSKYTVDFTPTSSGVISFAFSGATGDSGMLYRVSIKQVMLPLGWAEQDLCCAARELVDYCKQSCTLTLVTACTPAKVISIGTQAEFNRWQAIMYGTFDIQVQPSGGSCASGYEAVKLNLQSYYEFNDNFNDGSGNGLDGTGSSTATFGIDKSGKKGWAGLFDGASAYVDCGTSSRNITNAVTVSAWVNTTATVNQTVAAQQTTATSNGYQLMVNNTGHAAFTGYDGTGTVTVTSSNTVNDGNWHFLTGTCNNGIWNIYVDTILVGQNLTGSTSTVLTSTASFDMGAYNGSSQFFNGRIEQVGVYNSALNQHQIADLYNSGLLPYNITTCLTEAPLYEDWQVAPTASNGTGEDIYETSDGGVMYAYESYQSISGDTIVVIKLNSNGIIHSKLKFYIPFLGSTDYNGAILSRFKLTSDGGYLFGGYVNYAGGSDEDYWVAKFNSSGVLEFNKTFGGDCEDFLSDLNQTSDGGYIIGGSSSSGIGKDKTTANYGTGTCGAGIIYDDYWIVKIDSSGNYQWDSTYGGTLSDNLNFVQQTSDGGYILGGYSISSNDGNKHAANIGNGDFWVIKLNSSNNRQWENTYGGLGDDKFSAMKIVPSGGYIIAGYTSSGCFSTSTSSFTAIPCFGADDYWAIKIDNSGNHIWDKAYGGTAEEELANIALTNDGGYIFSGWSLSGVGGNKTTVNYGSPDYWVVKTDGNGNYQWDVDYGTTDFDNAMAVIETDANEYVIAGVSTPPAPSGNRTAPQIPGTGDNAWLIKLGPQEPCSLHSLCVKFIPPTQVTPPVVEPPVVKDYDHQTIDIITRTLNDQVANCKATNQQALINEYNSQCTGKPLVDSCELEYGLKYYHYTLYYYDRLDNLVKTVPPAGVSPLSLTAAGVRARQVHPSHTMLTSYKYNTLKQLQFQHTPDGDTSNFIYNSLGQLRFSQNAVQANASPKQFSYNIYDYLGRVVQVGKANFPTGVASFSDLNNPVYYDTDTFPSGVTATFEQTYTVYSAEADNVDYLGQSQAFLQNRVSYTYSYSPRADLSVSYYSYDPHGNVQWLVQQVPGIGKRRIGYEYDLISNKVTKVKYNESGADQFFHVYRYDADDRIIGLQTSANGYIWDTDASYSYYKHGPLKRTAIGEDAVQGMDYAYTLNGWLKGINTPTLSTSLDPGADGTGTSSFAPDEYGMVLSYFNGDFKRSSSVYNASNSYALNSSLPLYNGNISSWISKTQQEFRDKGGLSANYTRGNVYIYDQLNRILASNYSYYTGTAFTAVPDYHTDYTYDPNGNILKLNRRGYGSNLPMDSLTYTYTTGKNQLSFVYDSVTTDVYTTDLKTGQTAGNYVYDSIGNMIQDNQAGIAVSWNLYNKIDEVRPLDSASHKPALRFTYDASGNRVSKEVNTKPFPYTGTTPTRTPQYITTTYYIRDASGNIMAVYQRTNDSITGKHGYYTATYKLEEQPLYGSSRVGEFLPNTTIAQKVFATADLDKITIDTTLFVKETENVNLAATSQSSSSLGSGIFVDTVTINNYAYSSGSYNPTKKVSFVGSMGSNIAQAENSNGRVVIYSATPATYWGDSSVCLVYDSTGYLLANSDSIQSSCKGKSVIMQKSGSSTQYYLFTVSAGKLYYHTIDISSKTITSKNTLLDNTGSPAYTYGDHLTLLEDTYTNTGMLYATQYIPGTGGSPIGTLNVVAFTLTTKQTQQVPVVMTSFPTVNNGFSELQIAPDGKKLVVYNHLLKTGWFDHQESEIRTFTLGTDFKITSNPVVSAYPVVSLPNGTKSGMSEDFTVDNRYLYYTRDLLVELNNSAGGEKTVWRYDYRDNDTNLVKSGLMGDIRRGDNGDMNVAGTNLRTLDNWSQDPEGVITLNTPSATIGDSLTGALPIQSHKIYQDAPAVPNTFTRTLALKQYEITDHLGDVSLVVSDRKNVSIISGVLYDTADVISYSSYYPFGYRQPGRNSNLQLTLYGYNGKRFDTEPYGDYDLYDYGARIYDGRIARFESVDPLQKRFPSLTPYQFAGNNPIAMVDMDGLEPAPVSPNTHTLVIILQGYGGNPPDGKTQADNSAYLGLGRDEALGSIYSTGTSLKILHFASSSSGNTKKDVLATIKNFKANNPNGKLVLVGHSGGGDNSIELAKENPDVKVDLLITLDTQDPKIYGIDDNNIPKNVKNAINYYQTKEGIGGEKLDFTDETNGTNILSPGSNHRSIDNDQRDNVVKDINNFIKGNDAVKLAKDRVQPTYNPATSNSPDVGGLPGATKDVINPKSTR